MRGKGANRTWMGKAFPEHLEFKEAMNMIVQCKPKRSLKLYASGPTFGKDSLLIRLVEPLHVPGSCQH